MAYKKENNKYSCFLRDRDEINMDQGSQLLKWLMGKMSFWKKESYHAERLIRSYICNSRADIITSIYNMIIITMYNKNNYIFYYIIYDIYYII